eukprot:evm.model.scf_3044.1 EVM.evm.TU.scf_3044.1   scf_3044:14241-16742(+)
MRPNAVCPPGGARGFCSSGQVVLLCTKAAQAQAGGCTWTVLTNRRAWRCRPLACRPRWACKCHSTIQDGIMATPQQDGVLHDDSPENSLYPSRQEFAIILDKDDGHVCEGLEDLEEAKTDRPNASGSQTIEGREFEEPSATSEEAITELPSWEPQDDEQSDACDDYEEARDQERISKLAESLLSGQMEDSEFVELSDTTLGRVVKKLCGHVGHMKMAEAVMKRAIGLHRVSDIMLSQFFKSCGMQGRVDVMQSCFIHWLRQDKITYGQKSVNALITSCLKNRQLKLGMEIVRELMDHSRPVGTDTFNALIQEFGRAEKIEESLELFD